MSTIVYQERQSSYSESNFIESRTLSLKLNSSKQCQTPSNSFQELNSISQYGPKNASSSSSSNTSGGWSTIEALTSKKDGKVNEEAVYVHPLVKQSAFKLSDKSLEMCTESLGNETGTCDMDSGLFLPSTKMEVRKPQIKVEKVKKEVLVVDHGKFPPPLTTISGSNHIHVKPYRENGRLVMEAVSSPPIQSYMQAERSDGRLKLTMVRESPSDIINVDDSISFSDDDDDDACDNQGVDDHELDSILEECQEEEVCDDVEEDVKEVVVKKEEVKECSKDDAYLVERMNGKKVEFGVKNLGLRRIQRLSRCKEGSQRNKRLINLEPFWVAT